ncbi:MAG: hypothetical protein NTY38_14380, partial [Acidobacteria bacterium]|nr:hypothetical protein [Acidobacteriota bacterium]
MSSIPRKSPAIAALGLLLFSSRVLSQQPAPELKSQDTPATFQTRVNLVMVPVVVRDKNGRAIGNLGQDSFQLLDRGKPQMILKFSAERTDRAPTRVQVEPTPGATEKAPETRPAAVIPERFLAYVFDDMHLEFGALVQART